MDNLQGPFFCLSTARIGQLETDFSSNDFDPAADYDYNSLYYGAHLGSGYLLAITHNLQLDVYAKYLWTHIQAKDVSLSSGDKLSFQANDSHRARVGFKTNLKTKGLFDPYIGAAYDYEFGGEVNASSAGLGISSPSLTGGSLLGELGVSWKYKYMTTLNLALQGYAGKREGISGTFQISYIF